MPPSPPRAATAAAGAVSEQIGKVFISDPAVPLEVSFQDSTPTTPIFFILSPGVDPVQPVEPRPSLQGPPAQPLKDLGLRSNTNYTCVIFLPTEWQ